MIDRRDLVSCDEGGELAHKTRPTMVRWALEGRLRAERIAGRIYLNRDDCERLGAEDAARAKPNVAPVE